MDSQDKVVSYAAVGLIAMGFDALEMHWSHFDRTSLSRIAVHNFQ